MRKRSWLWLVAFVAAGSIGIYVATAPGAPHRRAQVYRIGWEEAPPFQTRGANGAATGFAVELVAEAARRRGIRLEWIFGPKSSERSLREGDVDLWPLVTIREERKRFLHFSEPYLRHDYYLIVRGGSAYWQPEDLSTAVIGHLDLPIVPRLLHQILPSARLKAVPSTKQAIEDVCAERADAMFTDEISALSTLFNGVTCMNQALRPIWIPSLQGEMAVASTFAARAVADELREEIGAMAKHGELMRIMTPWGRYLPRNLETTSALLSAGKVQRTLSYTATFFVGLSIAALLAANHIRRQRNRIKHEVGERERAEVTLRESERRFRDRKQAEAALRESEERFRNMADTAPVLIWIAGPDKRCTFFNKGWLTFTGKTLEEELGDGWTAGLHAQDREQCLSTYVSAFDQRRPFQMEYRLRSADDTYRWLRDEGVPRFGPDGEFAGYIGTCIDVTEIKRSHEAALARQKLESVGVLAGGIAHDFNNLLGSIMADAELALTLLPAGSEAAEGIARINGVSLRAAEIVRELLAYAGKESAVLETVNASALVREMMQFLSVSISKRAVLRVQLPEDLPAVHANAAQLRQVVLNLVTNASEALGEDGGFITVSASQSRVSGDALAEKGLGSAEGNYLRLEVRDTGCGMTEEVRARMFDPFFTTKFTGRGLGLAAVQGIVRGHGGAVNVKSTPGQGTLVEVLLPMLSDAAPVVARPRQTTLDRGPDGTDTTVLFVEDEESLRMPVARMLRRKGYSVIESGDGEAALELFRLHTKDIDVVLLDMTLPGMSGPEFFLHMRALRPDAKVIFTTAYSHETLMSSLAGYDSFGFVRKPYHLSDLLASLGEAAARTPHVA
ncbi:MAG: ATP-binding protein [Candidatus Solibacter sp.]